MVVMMFVVEDSDYFLLMFRDQLDQNGFEDNEGNMDQLIVQLVESTVHRIKLNLEGSLVNTLSIYFKCIV